MSLDVAYLVDTNVILRFLLDDHPVHSPASRKLFEAASLGKVALRIPFIAITETLFTLKTTYHLAPPDIGREIFKLLTAPGVSLTCPAWVLGAVEEYRDRNVAFGDACIAAEYRAANITVASFDKGLSTKFPDVKRYEPKV